MKKISLLFCLLSFNVWCQEKVKLQGEILHQEEGVAFANVSVLNQSIGTATDLQGNFELHLTPGQHILKVQAIGFKTQEIAIDIDNKNAKKLHISLEADLLGLNQVVVSATRNRISKKEAPVIVNVLSNKLFRATQSISLADGLNFQPGVRVETNCQNCGFTQVRLNGLGGEYTQILVNSRPVFSALNGVYGLEQIPVSIIDRVEVVRSGGSALFGANAIAGTVNVITKDPVLNQWEVQTDFASIDAKSTDRVINASASIVSDDLNSGLSIFGTSRDRQSYDADQDGFTEITALTNTSFGTKAFLKTNEYNRIGIDFTAIREYRRGGDRLNLAPQFTDITEELDHNTLFAGADYQQFSKDYKHEFTGYISMQHTDRESFYGGLGGGRTYADSIAANNAFGNTKDLALVAGTKHVYAFNDENKLTTGIEYQRNDTQDEINGYNRLIDQQVNNYSIYSQLEWKPIQKITTLIGARLDHVKLTGLYTLANIRRAADFTQTEINPRLTLLYDFNANLQFRGGYARGFRAPQAFNEDLHVSSVGGEPQFVILSDALESEYSNAYTASFNYTKNFKKVQTNFLIEGFYTQINNPFTIVSTGSSLPNGSILEETRNGESAQVKGINTEFSISPSKDFYLQLGATVQESRYKNAQVLFEADPNTLQENTVFTKQFVRAPDVYGFLNANWQLLPSTRLDVTGSYTGSMLVPRVVSETGFIRLNQSESFFDLGSKITYHFDINPRFHVELSGGVKNIFNAYQDDFDQGPTRDSDYIYGPALPRTYFIGLRFGDF